MICLNSWYQISCFKKGRVWNSLNGNNSVNAWFVQILRYRSCHFLLQCKFNFNLVGAKNIRRRVFSPASLENIYLQKWIDKLQHMLRPTISISLSSFSECKESSTSRLKIVLTKYGELLLKKVNIKDENSFDQIWRTSPKEKSTSMLKIILIKYGEFLLHHQNKKST